MFRYLLAFFIQFSVIINSSGFTQLNLNSTCTVARSNEDGICRLVNDCPMVVLEIAERGLFPTLCGFRDYDQKEIICCPKTKPAAIDTVSVQNKLSIPTEDRISYQSAFIKYFSTKYKNIFFLRYNCFGIVECAEYQKTCPSQLPSFDINSEEAVPTEFPHMVRLNRYFQILLIEHSHCRSRLDL